MQKAQRNLFKGFASAGAAQWKERVLRDLKGRPFENLIWHNENGFDIEPFYTRESLRPEHEPVSGQNYWRFCARINAGNGEEANRAIRKNLDGGATSFWLDTRNIDPSAALKDVRLKPIETYFVAGNEEVEALHQHFYGNYEMDQLALSIFPRELASRKDLNEWRDVVSICKQYPLVSTICADVLPYHNQNCDAAYEIAITLAALVEFLEGLPVNSLPEAPASVRMGVSCDYFVQIAKFRAMRRLWALLMKEYKRENKITIVAESSLTNKTISDPFNNLIRTSIEAMAAIAGCCLNFILSDYDVFAGSENSFSDRLSLHQGLIMEKEAYLATMTDIGFRSYYVENLTDKMAGSALEIFKRIEKEGGYFSCLEKGILEAEIGEQAARKEKEFLEGKRLSVGVNIFPNKNEKIKLSTERIATLRSLKVNNPALKFELDQLT